MISWTTVESFATSYKPGMKWWVLTQVLVASRTTQASLWQPFLLVGPILSCTMGSLITWSPHFALRQMQLSARPNHSMDTCPWTVFKGAMRVSERGAESRTLLQPNQTFLPSHQGWLGLVVCLWLQSQHATEELWDPVKNLCKCRVNSSHKINCDPKMRWCTVFLRTIKYIELGLWQWHCGFPRHTYIRPTSSRPYLLGCLKVVFQDPWSFGYHILHFHRLSCLLSETTRKTFSHGLFS